MRRFMGRNAIFDIVGRHLWTLLQVTRDAVFYRGLKQPPCGRADGAEFATGPLLLMGSKHSPNVPLSKRTLSMRAKGGRVLERGQIRSRPADRSVRSIAALYRFGCV